MVCGRTAFRCRHHLPLFTKALADSGYDCGLVGKWHLSACYGGRTEPRLDDGFRVFEWAHDPTHGSPQNAYHRWLEANHPELYARAIRNGPGRPAHEPVLFDTMPTETHYSHWVGERAIDFLETERADDDPFFLWVNFFDPHHPFVAPQEYLDRFDADALPAPLGSADDLATKPDVLQQAHLKSYAGAARGFAEYSPEEIRAIIRANYAMVSLIDDEVGRILAALERTGRHENTLVIFTSDHGEMQGDHGILLKGPMMYEGAVRVPLILRWPGVLPAGRRVDSLVQWIDLNASMLEAAGLAAPARQTRARACCHWRAATTTHVERGWALCEYRDSGHPYDPPVHTTMLRSGPYKLVVFHGDPPPTVLAPASSTTSKPTRPKSATCGMRPTSPQSAPIYRPYSSTSSSPPKTAPSRARRTGNRRGKPQIPGSESRTFVVLT